MVRPIDLRLVNAFELSKSLPGGLAACSVVGIGAGAYMRRKVQVVPLHDSYRGSWIKALSLRT